MAAAEIWLVRHGSTEWSESGRHTGRTDLPLTDRGRTAAGGLAVSLAGLVFDRVITSPLNRARETCEIAGFAARMEIVDDLREWDYGEYEGLTTAEIRQRRPGWTVWADGCPGGETVDDVGRRADRVVTSLRESDNRVAVFGHGHMLRVLGARWVGLAPIAGAVLALDTAGLSTLDWEREQPVLRRWNQPAGTPVG